MSDVLLAIYALALLVGVISTLVISMNLIFDFNAEPGTVRSGFGVFLLFLVLSTLLVLHAIAFMPQG